MPSSESIKQIEGCRFGGPLFQYNNLQKDERDSIVTLLPLKDGSVEFFKIDESSGIPIWLQVKNGLIHMIMSGKFQVGSQLPTVRELAVILSINYNTVSKVYAELERESYITSLRGRGTFVAERKTPHNDSINMLKSLTDEFVNKAFEAGFTIKDIESVVKQRLKG